MHIINVVIVEVPELENFKSKEYEKINDLLPMRSNNGLVSILWQ